MPIEVTKMFIKNKEIMNKSAVFRLKLSFPNVSGPMFILFDVINFFDLMEK